MAKVIITESFERTVDVYWLSDADEALGYVQNSYKKEEIVLDSEDFTGVTFSVEMTD